MVGSELAVLPSPSSLNLGRGLLIDLTSGDSPASTFSYCFFFAVLLNSLLRQQALSAAFLISFMGCQFAFRWTVCLDWMSALRDDVERLPPKRSLDYFLLVSRLTIYPVFLCFERRTILPWTAFSFLFILRLYFSNTSFKRYIVNIQLNAIQERRK